MLLDLKKDFKVHKPKPTEISLCCICFLVISALVLFSSQPATLVQISGFFGHNSVIFRYIKVSTKLRCN